MRKQIWNSKYGGIGGQIKTDVHLPGLISQLVKKSKIILLGVAAMAFLATLSSTVVSAKTQADIGPVDEGDFIITSAISGHGKGVKQNLIFKKDLFGKVIAQALESCDGESNLIRAMIRKM